MGTIHSELKLKIKCPKCNENLYGFSCFDDYNQEDHITVCKSCGFTESYDETITRAVNKIEGIKGSINMIKLSSCKYCRWNDNCSGNDTGIYPCPDYVRVQEESLRQHD